MNNQNLIREHIKLYDQLYKEQEDFYHRAAKQAGLSDAAHWVLYHLCTTGEPVIQSDLCKEWYFSKQTINSSVGKLMEMGYLNLQASNGSGNRKVLSLTEEGKAFCEKHVVPFMEVERLSFVGLSEEERETMLRLMRKRMEIMNREAEKIWQ